MPLLASQLGHPVSLGGRTAPPYPSSPRVAASTSASTSSTPPPPLPISSPSNAAAAAAAAQLVAQLSAVPTRDGKIMARNVNGTCKSRNSPNLQMEKKLLVGEKFDCCKFTYSRVNSMSHFHPQDFFFCSLSRPLFLIVLLQGSRVKNRVRLRHLRQKRTVGRYSGGETLTRRNCSRH